MTTTITLTSGEQVTGEIIAAGELILRIQTSDGPRSIFLHDIVNESREVAPTVAGFELADGSIAYYEI